MLGLRFCTRAFSSCGKWGPLFIVVRGPLTIAASLVAEHRLSSCGSQAYLLHGMWDLPRPGLEPVSPALAGRFSTTAPPGKPHPFLLGGILSVMGRKGCGKGEYPSDILLCLAASKDWAVCPCFDQPCDEATGPHSWPSLGLVLTPSPPWAFRGRGEGLVSGG